MALLTKEQILSADDLKTETVDVSEWWGGEVKISMMSGFVRDRFEAASVGKKGSVNMTNFRAKLIAATAVDDDGTLLFTEKEVTKLGNKSGAALDKLYDVAVRINKLSEKDVKDLAKN